MVGDIVQIGKGTIDDNHVNVLCKMGRSYAPERPSIDPYLSFDAKLAPAVLQDAFRILAHIFRRRLTSHTAATAHFASSIAPIVPAHHVDVLLEEEAQVVRMRVVDHVLIEHGIRIAQDKSWQLFEILISLQVILVDRLACGWEEHGVDFGGIGAAFDPKVLSVECLGKHFAHLLVFSEK